MDSILINQLQFYTPPQILKEKLSKSKINYAVARHVIDSEFRHRPQAWKSNAFPEYEDFFHAAIIGFNPYKKATAKAKDKR